MVSNIFSRILVGVDASSVSTEAVRLAARLAQTYGGELIAFHAVDWYRAVAMACDSTFLMDSTSIVDALREEGSTLLEDAAKIAAECGIHADVRMVDGDASIELLNACAAEKSTLIVMGTHGRSGIGRLVLGSTTEAVLRGSTLPVMTVRGMPWPSREAPHGFRRVLLAVDDSDPADAALDAALQLPSDPQRELFIYNVVTQFAISASPVRASNIEKFRFAQAQTIVDRAVDRAVEAGIAAHGAVEEGRPDEVIVSRAIDKAADLIIVGSHGRRGIQRFMLGSVAERVVRTAFVPVLVIRPS